VANIVVTNAAAFSAALKTVHAGDSILLAAGTYGLDVANFNVAGVTVASASATSPATIQHLSVSGSSGLTFKNLNFSTVGWADWYPYRISHSSNIQFQNLNVFGSTKHDPTVDKMSFLVRSSSNVSITNSNFHDLAEGITHLDSTGLLFSGDTFSKIEIHGIQGAGSSNVTIKNNTFTDFWPLNGDHPDAIIFWTDTAVPHTQNINISDNLITRGSGGAIQGIMLARSAGSGDFLNVSISNNVIVGTMWNGVIVDHINGGSISNNYVTGLSDMQSWIRVVNSAGVSLNANDAQNYILNVNNTNLKQTNSTTVPAASAASAASVILASTSMAETTAAQTIIGQVKGLTLSTAAIGGGTLVSRLGGEKLAAHGSHDVLVGGLTGDTFAFQAGSGRATLAAGAAVTSASGVNMVVGFHAGDTIDLSAVDPKFRIVSAFDHQAHELIVHNDGNGAWDIYGDTVGAGLANFQVHLIGVTTPLNTTDIHL
jgi:hypothetical protein